MFRRGVQTALSFAARNAASDLLPTTRAAACGCSTSLVDPSSLRHTGHRSFADLAEEPEEFRAPAVSNARVQRLVEEIVSLNLIEVADMTELLKKKLKLDGLPGMMPMGAMQQPGAAAPAQAAAPAKEEQSEFDVTLEGFGASDKIKVIKEVRAILPELGLKDAKVLVGFVPRCRRYETDPTFGSLHAMLRKQGKCSSLLSGRKDACCDQEGSEEGGG